MFLLSADKKFRCFTHSAVVQFVHDFRCGEDLNALLLLSFFIECKTSTITVLPPIALNKVTEFSSYSLFCQRKDRADCTSVYSHSNHLKV